MDGRLSRLQLKPGLDLAALMPDLSEKQRTLDVVVLHRLILERRLGITEDAVTKEKPRSFLLNPTRLDQMRDTAHEGISCHNNPRIFMPKFCPA